MKITDDDENDVPTASLSSEGKFYHRYKKAAAGLLTAIVLPVDYCSISVVAHYKKITIVKLILLIKFACLFLFFFTKHFFYLGIFYTAHQFRITIDLN